MIQKDSVVGLRYTLKDDQGSELDRADAETPFFYLHGAANIIPGLEDALLGLKPGDTKKVSVEAKDGYGEVNAGLVLTVEKSMFPSDEALVPGMEFGADVGTGRPMVFTVQKIEGDKVIIDGNHPLAGKRLHFDVEVLSVRQATADELSHGHAHGPDGHHHH
jgi:FKBP-type peptidyl-prolyl cis-trans isomerase SlyD